MTLEELLKGQNLTDEQVTAIIDGMKENKIFTASEENLDIRYGKLKTDHDALAVKDAESQKLIEELQKATKGQDAVQAKITEYEATIARQQEELQQAKTEAALKVVHEMQLKHWELNFTTRTVQPVAWEMSSKICVMRQRAWMWNRKPLSHQRWPVRKHRKAYLPF